MTSTNETLVGVTWRDLAQSFPDFVEWAVQTFGPLPDGDITRTDYERLTLAYASLGE